MTPGIKKTIFSPFRLARDAAPGCFRRSQEKKQDDADEEVLARMKVPITAAAPRRRRRAPSSAEHSADVIAGGGGGGARRPNGAVRPSPRRSQEDAGEETSADTFIRLGRSFLF